MIDYYPLLLSKKGEIDALRQIKADQKRRIRPIIELVKSDKTYLRNFTPVIGNHWDYDGAYILIDYARLASSTNRGLLHGIKADIEIKSARTCMVLRLGQSPYYYELYKELSASSKVRALRIRVHKEETLNDALDLIAKLDIESKDTIIIFDYGSIASLDVQLYREDFEEKFKEIRKRVWKDIVVLGGSFPADLSDLAVSDEPHFLRRHEEILFDNIKAHVYEYVKYGDYCIRHPEYTPPANHPGSVSLKYTFKSSFVIYRGQQTTLNEKGHGQFIDHCKSLIKTETFGGSGYSWGDDQILLYAKEDVNDPERATGNNTTWITIGITHHISVILDLSEFSSSSFL